MKNHFNKSLGGVLRKYAAIAFVVSASTLAISADATADIAATKHNLGSTGTANKTLATGEICVFCHTPHGSDTSAKVPLWNRVLPTPGTFTTYDNLGTSSLDANTLAVGSVSLACLSCHDGSQALDSIINAPGSGGYNALAPSQVWAFTSKNQLNDGAITQIGTDLQNDHPIGIRYAGGDGAASGAMAVLDADFYNADYSASKGVWWIDTDGGVGGAGNGTRESTDLMLYTRDDSGTDRAFVECASCHDPHSDTNATFLRISNTGSNLCRSCHNK